MEKQTSSTSSKKDAANIIKFLLVSDIHLAYEHLDKLLTWEENGEGCGVKESNLKYDFILGSGDFGNVNHVVDASDLECDSALDMIQKRYDSMTEEQRTEEENAERDIAILIQGLEERIPGHPQIYYVPGNHDPKQMFLGFDIRPSLTEYSYNVHNTWVELRPDLALVSLGGSLPSYLQKRGTTERTPIYQPYPYFRDELFKKDLDALLAQVTAKQIILMTHDGPMGSATATDKTTKIDEGADIIFGSEYLCELLKNDKRIIANVHGHCHEGAPEDKIVDNAKVLNPGSLKFAECAELIIKKDADTGYWKVVQYNKHYL